MSTESMDLRLKIFAAYAPCLCVYSDTAKGPYAIEGVSITEGVALFSWDDDSDWWNVTNQTKLILRPLKQILPIDLQGLKDLGYSADLVNAIKNVGLSTEELSLESAIEITDYLRERGYMIPFRGIDLFEQGIAVSEMP